VDFLVNYLVKNLNDFLKHLDLKSVPCPLNVVKIKLALEKLSKNEQLIVELDKGEPEEMVLNNLKEMGCLFKQIKENEKFIKIKILNDNDLTDIKFINEIIKNNAGEEESKKLLIYFAIKHLKWDIARENVIGMIGSNPSKDICYFMSEIELGENNDKQKSDAWIMRAENAKLENSWICRITNQSQEEWSSLSNSGNYNSLVWSSPMMIRKNRN